MRRRPRPRMEWIASQSTNGDIQTTGTAGTPTVATLVSSTDIRDYGFGGDLFVRRVVGHVLVAPASAAAGRASVVVYKRQEAAAGTLSYSHTSVGDYEDQRQIIVRDYISSVTFASASPSHFDCGYFDWRGWLKLNEGMEQLILSFQHQANYHYMYRLRCLVQAPRG